MNKLIENIPELSGVYIMKKAKKIIYIGKAKNLKKRLSSYFSGNKDEKTKSLVENIEEIEYFISNTELDALILENNLIKKHKPKYNIMLKDNKTYPYLKLSFEKFPKLSIVRNTKYLNDKKAEYYGPYPSGAFYLLDILQKNFLVRTCNKDMNKIYEKPCLRYYMKYCIAPCVNKSLESEYNENIKEIKKVLSGNYNEILEELNEKMLNFSDNMNFEKALIYREKIKEIKRISENQISEYGKDIDEDVFISKKEGNKIFIFVLNIREGKIIGKNSTNIDLNNFYDDDTFTEILITYYSKISIPKNLILENEYLDKMELLKNYFKLILDKNINFYFPIVKSRRKELLEMAKLNLEEEIKKYYNQKQINEKGIKDLKEILSLRNYPRKIECYDISNIQGKDAIASMSYALEGKALTKQYRKYKIRGKDSPDDFYMIREVLERRYSKLDIKDYPDLILIDGGKGQLSSAFEILEKYNVLEKVDLISIAKKEEIVFKWNTDIEYKLSKFSEALKILQRLRDEAHRFGITYHRKLRSKRVISSELDDIKGIGEIRKKKLFEKFKTIENIKNASLEELSKIIPLNIAKNLKE